MAESRSAADASRKQRRDPDRTREAILEVAGRVLSKDGPEGLSVSQVAQIAGVNRGTAYHHFKTREQLLNETMAWVSEKLSREVFGDRPQAQGQPERLDPRMVTARLVEFAMENPEFGRIWLFRLLGSSRPSSDPFWKLYKAHIDEFVDSELAQPGIDSEVHAVLMLIGVFLWPVWARAHAHSAKGRRALAERFSNEVLRFSLSGSMRKEKFPDLASSVAKPARRRKA